MIPCAKKHAKEKQKQQNLEQQNLEQQNSTAVSNSKWLHTRSRLNRDCVHTGTSRNPRSHSSYPELNHKDDKVATLETNVRGLESLRAQLTHHLNSARCVCTT
jgi:hypothetical protein